MRRKSFFRASTKSSSTTSTHSKFAPPVIKSNLISEVSRDTLADQIEKSNSFSEFWEQYKNKIIRLPLSEYLCSLLTKKGLRRSDVVARTGLDKAYVYQIFAGKKKPSRNKLITIAFGMKLNEKETQRMLKLSGHRELWPKDERDALFLFAIQRGMSLNDVDTELDRYGLEPLADPVK